MSHPIKLEASWLKVLKDEFDKKYFKSLSAFLKTEKQKVKVIFPQGNKIFAALDHPYHGIGQAHGFCFSVQQGTRIPPSLLNIYKELLADLEVPIKKEGDLTHWADQGILLLNAILTVESGLAGSHQNKGWEIFTDAIIDQLNQQKEGIVFLLWGNFARQKGALIDKNKHHVLSSGHPSPLSAAKGHWFGNKHFSQTNALLKQSGKPPIAW
jgi:uracil-DNA glycosylase